MKPRRQVLQFSLRTLLLVTLVAAGVCFWIRQRSDHWPVISSGTAREEGEISVPVAYKDLMLAMTDSNGVAAVVFSDEIKDERIEGVTYRFRYESPTARHASRRAFTSA